RDRVLTDYKTDRAALCDALEQMNRGWNASAKTIEHITNLRDPDCIAVVSGQQAGLFGGPLYTIYKALSAVKLAAGLSQRAIKAVPVFWIATEAHAFAEVAAAEFINRDCQFSRVSASREIHSEGLPVGRVTLNETISGTIESLLDALPGNEFSDQLEKLLCDAYQPGRKFGDAFASIMAALTGTRGLILLDPLDPQLKRLAAPVYGEAARHAPDIAGT